MSVYTPGPWVQPVRYSPEDGVYVPCGAIETIDGRSIAIINCPDVPIAEWSGNATLISAAPEMAEALQFIIRFNGSTGGLQALVSEFKFRAAAALAKAGVQ